MLISSCVLFQRDVKRIVSDEPSPHVLAAVAAAEQRVRHWASNKATQDQTAADDTERRQHKPCTGNRVTHRRTVVKPKKPKASSSGLSRAQIRELQSREITAEDYELLLRLDDSVPKRDVMSDADAARLLIETSLNAEAECSVCLCDCQVGEAAIVLSCRHVFHGPCLKAWATKGRNTCPMCNALLAQGCD